MPLWRNFTIALNAKYLGIIIGPGGAEAGWVAALRKFRSRVETIVSMPLGMFMTGLAYRIFALSTLSFIMQLTPVRQDWDQLQEDIGRKLAPGPYNWIPPRWLFDHRSDMTLPSMFVDLRALHDSVLIRTARSLTPTVRRAAALRRSISADGEPIYHPWQAWRRAPMVQLLADVRSESRAYMHPPDDKTSIQSHYYRQILDARPLEVESHTWERRLSKWRDLMYTPPYPRVLRAQAAKILVQTRRLPPSTRWALVRTWFNGWCTARHFQSSVSCFFCKAGEDSLEHMCRCPVIRLVGNSRLGFGLKCQQPDTIFPLRPFASVRPGSGKARIVRARGLPHAQCAAHRGPCL